MGSKRAIAKSQVQVPEIKLVSYSWTCILKDTPGIRLGVQIALVQLD